MPRKKSEETIESPALQDIGSDENTEVTETTDIVELSDIAEGSIPDASGDSDTRDLATDEHAEPSLPFASLDPSEPPHSHEFPDSSDDSVETEPSIEGNGEVVTEQESAVDDSKPRKKAAKPTASRARKKSIYDLDIRELDRKLSPDEQKEWSAIYASYRSKSILTGTVVGVDQTSFEVLNRETGVIEKKKLYSLIIIGYRVKVLIPESEVWIPDDERPDYVLRNMTGSVVDYIILDVDREGECAIASRRMALAVNRQRFSAVKGGHKEGELLTCRVLSAGPHRCSVEVGGYDVELTPRDLSYTAIPDLREKYHPGQELDCVLKSFDRKAGKLEISVKEAKPNPFFGAEKRHPVNCRRKAVISGKYKGGVFCTLPDDTICLCLYTSQHSDMDFDVGDTVIVVIRQYDHNRLLIYGRILTKW